MKLPKVPWKNMGRHWGRSQNQGRQDQSHAALLHRLTGHTVTGRAMSGNLFWRCHPEQADTRITMSSAIDTIAASTAMENMVPMP